MVPKLAGGDAFARTKARQQRRIFCRGALPCLDARSTFGPRQNAFGARSTAKEEIGFTTALASPRTARSPVGGGYNGGDDGQGRQRIHGVIRFDVTYDGRFSEGVRPVGFCRDCPLRAGGGKRSVHRHRPSGEGRGSASAYSSWPRERWGRSGSARRITRGTTHAGRRTVDRPLRPGVPAAEVVQLRFGSHGRLRGRRPRTRFLAFVTLPTRNTGAPLQEVHSLSFATREGRRRG